ncbi:MAG TPA: aminoacyl-tRNA hydrolase [Desulfotomaculum sp.]|nr:MAG: Peptidyl-tRNA hydrolase [Desulfotomaculum sp. 46_80]HAG10389.1 aminoacyl-tRNA hydrolase [Desulfotomaculum sp.]HBY04178.1 aminoacyl-tRNA hydrolase [Desulfotomaculum sp.]
MLLITGLGNPGNSYSNTRHSIGFKVIDWLARERDITNWRLKCKALVANTEFQEQKIILAKPQTYMNNSGESVVSLLHWYRLSNQDLIVICDDVDLPLGRLRIRGKGGDGGHRGLRSIIDLVGSKDFIRLRVGVGRPLEPDFEMVDWVLSRFSSEEALVVEQMVEKAAQAIKTIAADGIEKAMNMYN